jgi:uncharacterized protein YdiU (UPF0061 family)
MGRIRAAQINESLERFELKKRLNSARNKYQLFDAIDGKHPWQELMPESVIMYSVRKLNHGTVKYFNFALAKEMGLIPKDHKHTLNKSLKNKILETFNLRIINEYDQKNNVRYHPSVMKKNKYMATRYLQLQHADKCGRTSGDGRSIWNGCIEHNGVLWDISSRGTGVTALAPGVIAAGRPLETGNNQFGYGCGMADLDELYSSAIMAETLHHQGIETERVLAIIDIDGSNGIGVRAGKNLMRPAHLFAPLKQGNHDLLKRATDYFIQRQYHNKKLRFSVEHPNRYELLLDNLTSEFAQFAAQLERQFIFAWMDWDGDNALAHAGIIDYGSIRVLGLRHDEYRYDDVERMSTNLNEQKKKIRLLVQTYAQMIDFLKSGTKKPIESFNDHSCLKKFDRLFEKNCIRHFLKQMGFDEVHAMILNKEASSLVRALYEAHIALESAKTTFRRRRVPDGINRPAILNMRRGLKYLAEHYDHKQPEPPPVTAFFKACLARHTHTIDRKLRPNLKIKLQHYMDCYFTLLDIAFSRKASRQYVHRWRQNVFKHNPEKVLTGDAVIIIVDELMSIIGKKGFRSETLQSAIDQIIEHNTGLSRIKSRVSRTMSHIFSLIDAQSESI